MAFVFIQHLAPQHASMLPLLLSRTTAMPVMEVQHGMPVEPNHVYIIPPNTLMRIEGGILKLEPRPEERGAPRPIDCFLHSLAEDRKAAAIGVIYPARTPMALWAFRLCRGAHCNRSKRVRQTSRNAASCSRGRIHRPDPVPEEVGDALEIGAPFMMGRDRRTAVKPRG
jgi:hypothetical protein